MGERRGRGEEKGKKGRKREDIIRKYFQKFRNEFFFIKKMRKRGEGVRKKSTLILRNEGGGGSISDILTNEDTWFSPNLKLSKDTGNWLIAIPGGTSYQA